MGKSWDVLANSKHFPYDWKNEHFSQANIAKSSNSMGCKLCLTTKMVCKGCRKQSGCQNLSLLHFMNGYISPQFQGPKISRHKHGGSNHQTYPWPTSSSQVNQLDGYKLILKSLLVWDYLLSHQLRIQVMFCRVSSPLMIINHHD